jgi:predicted SnoaL-like aldol condensation-catalyzing enzyme
MADLNYNKRLTLEFLELAFNEGKMREAIDRYVDARRISASPLNGLGPESSVNRGTWAVREHFELRHDVRRIIAEGDLVAVHSLIPISSRGYGTAVVDIFRVKDGKLVDHWDVWDMVKLVPNEPAPDDVVV